MYDVVAIGSATRDNFLKANYPLTNWPAAPLKKAIVLPLGEKLGVDEAYFKIGGNSANASVTFARHGFKTACLAKVGNDLPGAEILEQLKKEGVSTSLSVISNEKPTAYSALLLRNGERTILSYHGASDTLSIRDLDLEKLKARWWYISLAGESDAMYPSLIQFAKKNKIKVAFNPSGHHIKHWPNEILDSLKDIEFLVLNTGEAADLLKMPYKKEKEVFKELDKRMPGIVAITDGPNGAIVSDGKRIYRSGIYREKEIVDRTGAGDAFGSGFTAMLARFRNYGDADLIKKAIRFAAANSTSVVEHIGATDGILTREEFDKDPRWKDLEIKIESLT
ncbi:MAG: putative Ribokinase [Parcubacteria group bacterium Gr01-1014_3]|nr:MAG: putative Ribokinase [Parcubacteria group bacterium Gr01-1014_3]